MGTVGVLAFPSPERLSPQSPHTCEQSCDLRSNLIITPLRLPKHAGPAVERPVYKLGECVTRLRDRLRQGEKNLPLEELTFSRLHAEAAGGKGHDRAGEDAAGPGVPEL